MQVADLSVSKGSLLTIDSGRHNNARKRPGEESEWRGEWNNLADHVTTSRLLFSEIHIHGLIFTAVRLAIKSVPMASMAFDT